MSDIRRRWYVAKFLMRFGEPRTNIYQNVGLFESSPERQLANSLAYDKRQLYLSPSSFCLVASASYIFTYEGFRGKFHEGEKSLR